MGPDQSAWQRVKRIFDEVRALPDDQRVAFLDQRCGADHEVRREVESLLAHDVRADDFLEQPAARIFSRWSASGPVEGQTIGPYRIGTRVGAGGMGEVYKAVDTRLGRTVAIKVLPAHLAADPDQRKRFEREARAVAALNHPHISTLHDIGTQDGTDFLVMEFLEGETLAARLSRGRMPPAKALECAVQIGAALDAAHRSGIVHRDLKPANVMLTPSGAKLLDFGLAKPRTHASQAGEAAPRELTGPGIVLGTARYMAPEQVEGKEADARSDLFAFGVVLHEMLSGRKAFDAPTSAQLAAAILALQPPRVSELDPAIPTFLDYVVSRCLAKDPGDRWQTARDLLAELERSRASLTLPPAHNMPGRLAETTATRKPASTWIARASLGVVATALVTSGYLLLNRPVTTGEVVRLSILPPPGGFDLSPDPTVSPNGAYVVYEAQDAQHRTQIWLKSLRSSAAHPIPGTEGTEFQVGAFWSPDSRTIGFFADGKLKRINIDGTSLQVLASAPEARGGTWSPSGVIIFNADTQNLMRVPAAGGNAIRIAEPASGGVRLFPHALPDGDHYLFTSRNAGGQGLGVYLASLNAPEIHRISDAWSPASYANGHLLFVRQQVLFAQRLDVDSRRLGGEPKQIAEGIGIGCCSPLSFAYSSSANAITYWSGTTNPKSQLTWFDRSGNRIGVAGEPGTYLGFSMAQDERHVALERSDPVTSSNDIWILDSQRAAVASRLTSDGRFSSPVLSPTGERLAVMERGRGIVTMPVSGGATEVMVEGAISKWPIGWSRDGRTLIFTDAGPTGTRVWMATADGSTSIYREGPFIFGSAALSPDSKWLAYVSNESGRYEVYVDSFPRPSARSRVSEAGGTAPKWRHDGLELYYLAPDRKLMASRITNLDVGLAAAPAVALFEAPAVSPDSSRTQFSPSADGSRFLFNARVDDATPVGLSVILNWAALLER